MSFTRFEADIWIRQMAEQLLAPPVFSDLPKPTEEEIEEAYQILKQVDWKNINLEDEHETEIVHCKDCKYGHLDPHTHADEYRCDKYMYVGRKWHDWWFGCSLGERR